MGLFLTTAASLLSVYGGAAGVELLLDRYATPEARAVVRRPAPPDVRLRKDHPGAEQAEAE
jgi:hypothetical protein